MCKLQWFNSDGWMEVFKKWTLKQCLGYLGGWMPARGHKHHKFPDRRFNALPGLFGWSEYRLGIMCSVGWQLHFFLLEWRPLAGLVFRFRMVFWKSLFRRLAFPDWTTRANFYSYWSSPQRFPCTQTSVVSTIGAENTINHFTCSWSLAIEAWSKFFLRYRRIAKS